MIRWAAALILVAWGAAALAQPFPARHDVTGVAAGDALNLRAEPSAAAPVVGRLEPGTRGVEVLGLSPDGAWARIGRPEGEAWAARRFLSPQPADPRVPPLPLRCQGTEPFWSLTVDASGLGTFETPEQGRALRPLGQGAAFQGFVLAFDDGGRTRDLTVMRAECTDGMSNRPYGWAALVWDRGDEVLEGCCLLLGE